MTEWIPITFRPYWYKSTLIALILVLGLVAVLPLRPSHAQQTANLQGRVVNGTTDALAPSGLTVRLVAQLGETLLDEREASTDGEGLFLFSEVSVDPNASYFVTTGYRGVEYTVRVDPQQPDATWRLVVYETTSDTTNIRLAENTLFLPRADEQRRHLLALELVRVQNAGDLTFVPDLSRPQEMGLLRFSLPPGAADLDVQSSLRGGSVVPVDRGFAITTPLPPGNHDILFSYAIPYSGGTLTYERTFPFGTAKFELLMGEAGGLVTSAGLEQSSAVVIEEKRYSRLVGNNIVPGTRVELTLSGMPQPSLLRRVIQPFQSGAVATVGVPVLAGVVLALLLAYAYWRGHERRRKAHATLTSARVAPSREGLLTAVVELDDRFSGGSLPESEYRAERDALMERLRAARPVDPSSTPGQATRDAE